MTPAVEELEADYEALRRGCGVRMVTRDVVEVVGPDASEYLQGQCSQELSGLEPGESTETLVLQPDGKISSLARVLRRGPESFALVTDPGFGHALADRLARFRLRTKVKIDVTRWAGLELRGPGAAALAGPAGPERWLLGAGWGGAIGLDVLSPDESELSVPEGARRCSDEAFAALRIESGQPVLGRELDERTIPPEAGEELVARTVSFTKGCYTGQELVARLDSRGNRVPRRLAGLVPAGDDVAAAGSELVTTGESGDKNVGRITSAAWCPGLGKVGALGYVHRSVEDGATVHVGELSGPPIEVRGLPLVVPGS